MCICLDFDQIFTPSRLDSLGWGGRGSSADGGNGGLVWFGAYMLSIPPAMPPNQVRNLAICIMVSKCFNSNTSESPVICTFRCW